MRLYVRLLIGLFRRSMRGRRDLLMENPVLRQQLGGVRKAAEAAAAAK